MWLLDLDKNITLVINQFYNPIFDPVMIFFSHKLVWIPLYALIVAGIIKKDKYQSLWVLLSIGLLILLADQSASGVLKPLVQRLRPCHEPLLYPFLHLPTGCGGSFGFASSHAANSMALAIFLWLYFKNRVITIGILIWALMVSYSRVYLGAHYAGDVLVGMAIGAFWSFLIFKAYQVLQSKLILLGNKQRNEI
jgi:undecaprenyl-diphosphatase